MSAPLVVTLALDAAAEARFEAERLRAGGFTAPVAGPILFRAVPAELEEQVRVDLVQLAGPSFPVGVAGVLPLPRGAAYALVSVELARRHRELQQRWWDHLADRDRRPLRPHITVQNGVTPAQARSTAIVLRRAFRPHELRAEAFVLWRGAEQWTELARIPFA